MKNKIGLKHYALWQIKNTGLEKIVQYEDVASNDIVIFQNDTTTYKTIRHTSRDYEVYAIMPNKVYDQQKGTQ